jgi:ubiquinone/menaquinone biosynthesis C-methylase UbiE
MSTCLLLAPANGARCAGLPSASQDLVSIQFVMHECPAVAIRDLIREARRLLRPGGIIFLVDNNPRCAGPPWAAKRASRAGLFHLGDACVYVYTCVCIYSC